MKGNATLLGFIRKELKQTLRDTRMRFVLFVGPVVQLTIFAIALSNEVKNIRIAALHDPSDTMVEEIYQHALASTWFIPSSVEGNDPFTWVRARQADVVLVAPPGGLTHAIGRGKGNLQLLINAQNVIRAQAIENYLKAISAQVLMAGQPKPPAPLMNFDVRVLYNPMLETSIYMVPGVLCMLVCVVTILLTSMALARERELGTLETLIAAPVEPWEVILGKTIPFMLLGLIQLMLILAVATIGFKVPMRGPLIMVVLSGFFFVVTTVTIGTLISTVSKNQQQAMLGGFLFIFPAVMLSGLLFPIENMPIYLYWTTYFNPLTHFIALLRNILLKGGDWDFFLTHTGALAALAVVGIFTAFKRFHTKLG